MAAAVDKSRVPWWVSNLIVPLVNLILALLVSALFIFIAGENPIHAVKLIIYGSFGYLDGFAYTLYYTTNFVFIYFNKIINCIFYISIKNFTINFFF